MKYKGTGHKVIKLRPGRRSFELTFKISTHN